MILEFDENKDYTIEELEELRSKCWDVRNAVNHKITEVQIKDYNFTNKFVYSESYGYMYVTWQKFDSPCNLYGDDRMFFQGLNLNANLGEYQDDSWFHFSALGEWYIPINSFLDDIKNGRFKEITKDEFMEVLKTSINLHTEITEWVEFLENKKDEE